VAASSAQAAPIVQLWSAPVTWVPLAIASACAGGAVTCGASWQRPSHGGSLHEEATGEVDVKLSRPLLIAGVGDRSDDRHAFVAKHAIHRSECFLGLVKGGFDLVRGGGVASDSDGAAAGFPALGGGCVEFWSGRGLAAPWRLPRGRRGSRRSADAGACPGHKDGLAVQPVHGRLGSVVRVDNRVGV
jgi:hypothetical protein